MLELPQQKYNNNISYLMENVDRAMQALLDPSLSHTEKINHACLNIHKSNNCNETINAMSFDTLNAWYSCCPKNIDKKIEDMNANELETLSNNLIAYLIGIAFDYGIAAAGKEPANYYAYHEIDSYENAQELRHRRSAIIESQKSQVNC